MDETQWGEVFKVIGVVAVLFVLGRACEGGKDMYPEPDPMDYDSMVEYQRDKNRYDRDYQEARDDHQYERSYDNSW